MKLRNKVIHVTGPEQEDSSGVKTRTCTTYYAEAEDTDVYICNVGEDVAPLIIDKGLDVHEAAYCPCMRNN